MQNKKLLYKIAVFIVLIILLTVVSCSQATKERFIKTFFNYFDTVTTVVGYDISEKSFDENCKLILNELNEYHKLYDIYNEYDGINNLCTVNKNAGEAPIKVDGKIIDLLEFSREMHSKTNGYVNIAMGSVTSLWHKFRDEANKGSASASIPSIASLEEASSHCNIDCVVIDKDASTVFLSDSEMTLDVGAIAKGYATERIAVMLERAGIDNYTINVGGNIRAIGDKADNTPWVAGIQNPNLSDDNRYVATVGLCDCALVTSGDYHRYYTVDEKKYSHIIHPKTLMPSDLYSSVSVISYDSGIADALSTALFNMSYEDGLSLLSSIENTEAMWITTENNMLFSDKFQSYINQ